MLITLGRKPKNYDLWKVEGTISHHSQFKCLVEDPRRNSEKSDPIRLKVDTKAIGLEQLDEKYDLRLRAQNIGFEHISPGICLNFTKLTLLSNIWPQS